LNAEWATQSWVKFYAIYDQPFWQAHTTGSHFLDFETRFDVYDVSPADGSQGLIVGLLPPDYSTMAIAERQVCCLNFLADTFGELARHPQELIEFDWHDQAWTGGCVSMLPPNLLSQVGAALNASVGRLYWAGTERSPVWTNYIEGAIRSGKAAARQVIADNFDNSLG
jgi:monoamine oxidase